VAFSIFYIEGENMKITTCERNARQMWDWIKNRTGVAVWQSIDLSDPYYQVLTPVLELSGKPYTRPHWKCSNTPEIITNPDDIKISVDAEHKRFHVAVRMGSNGMCYKVTDYGSEKIRREVEKAGEGAYYVFDYDDFKNAVIMKPTCDAVTLTEWAKKEGWN
jgi:hypothetical protein